MCGCLRICKGVLQRLDGFLARDSVLFVKCLQKFPALKVFLCENFSSNSSPGTLLPIQWETNEAECLEDCLIFSSFPYSILEKSTVGLVTLSESMSLPRILSLFVSLSISLP
jgi:hypothetical protein